MTTSGVAMGLAGWADKVQGAPECRGRPPPEFQAKKLCTWMKLLTDLRIVSCEFHETMPLAVARGYIALPLDP